MGIRGHVALKAGQTETVVLIATVEVPSAKVVEV